MQTNQCITETTQDSCNIGKHLHNEKRASLQLHREVQQRSHPSLRSGEEINMYIMEKGL